MTVDPKTYEKEKVQVIVITDKPKPEKKVEDKQTPKVEPEQEKDNTK